AVVIVCRDEEAARRRFAVRDDGAGIVYTRTGRRFFNDRVTEAELLSRLREALTAAGYWEQFNSDWFCLDCELMPWSAKAQDLLKNQYAAVGSAARAALADAAPVLGAGAERHGQPLRQIVSDYADRSQRVRQYVDAYRRYCWPVNSV